VIAQERRHQPHPHHVHDLDHAHRQHDMGESWRDSSTFRAFGSPFVARKLRARTRCFPGRTSVSDSDACALPTRMPLLLSAAFCLGRRWVTSRGGLARGCEGWRSALGAWAASTRAMVRSGAT
jgi:hypothetical protein